MVGEAHEDVALLRHVLERAAQLHQRAHKPVDLVAKGHSSVGVEHGVMSEAAQAPPESATALAQATAAACCTRWLMPAHAPHI